MRTELAIDSLLIFSSRSIKWTALITITRTIVIQVTEAIGKRRKLDIKPLGNHPHATDIL